MSMDELDTSSFADRQSVGAVIISVMLTISIVASIYICLVAQLDALRVTLTLPIQQLH